MKKIIGILLIVIGLFMLDYFFRVMDGTSYSLPSYPFILNPIIAFFYLGVALILLFMGGYSLVKDL